MRVAIADDDPIVCSSLFTILEATGTADVAWTANTGTDAVTQYEMDAPDVLLVDVQMPGMDGLQASEAILTRIRTRESLSSPHSPTSHTSPKRWK